MPPPAAELAAQRQLEQQHLALLAATAADSAWSSVSPTNIALSWSVQLPRAYAVVVGAQQLAADRADTYVDAALAEQGFRVAADGAVRASRLAGVASDGRPLESLLVQPAIHALQAIRAGATPAEGMQVGRMSLDMIVRTQVADAGRGADSIAVTARPRVKYVRMVQPGACARCVVLAGRVYRWSDGFERHPRCHCIHVPVGDGVPDGLITDPAAYFATLSPAEQDRVFTVAGAQAIRDGADISRVVNARRGMSTTATLTGRHRLSTQLIHGRAAFTTTEGTARRSRRSGPRVRLMPEQIYLDAGGDREEAVRLLRLHGYLI